MHADALILVARPRSAAAERRARHMMQRAVMHSSSCSAGAAHKDKQTCEACFSDCDCKRAPFMRIHRSGLRVFHVILVLIPAPQQILIVEQV